VRQDLLVTSQAGGCDSSRLPFLTEVTHTFLIRSPAEIAARHAGAE
jgi:hypothetical protein